MSEWSRKAAEQIRRRQVDHRISNLKFVEVQQMKREAGPRLWKSVQAEIVREIAELNHEMGREFAAVEESSSTSLVIRASLPEGVERLHVSFNPSSGVMEWQGDSRDLRIGKDGAAAFYSYDSPHSPAVTAVHILETLLGTD